ncbi:MAG: family 43 glycosylhydrolase [Bacteroidales bacterium]|nr:family 43 glycosylhydrolase [Bacteroidales bacterium]
MMVIRKLKVACLLTLFAGVLYGQEKAKAEIPIIDGEWWQVAGDPDLGEYTSPKQQPVDFGVWQAVDGTWQLWSCIRHTECGGMTRLFHRWEGKNLTDPDWKPMGIAMEADTTLGETKGGLQAPHVIKVEDTFYMFYGDWVNICLAKSKDGKNFTRVLNDKGTPALFTGPLYNTRDPMVLEYNGLFYYYSMGSVKDTEPHSAIFCHTSADLENWSEPMMVSAGGNPVGKSRWFGGDAECPFIVNKDGQFYLFRNQMYGEDNLNTQYCSPNLLDFGVDDDKYLIGEMSVAAPEIIFHEGEYYMASLLPSLKGIRIAKLKWTKE